MADFEVRLESQVGRLTRYLRLQSFVREQSDVLDPNGSENAVLFEAGVWLTKNIIGVEICAKIISSRLSLVVVDLPEPLGYLTMLPLNLSIMDMVPLYGRNIQFIYRTPPVSRMQENIEPTTGLRILAVFSSPADLQALDLRRERVALTNFILGSQVRNGNAVELKVLHYGATRESLANAILDGEGWDVIHISGHGDQQLVFLEDGAADGEAFGADELIGLLRNSPAATHRLKLTVLSTCNSAASDLQETLAMLTRDTNSAGNESGVLAPLSQTGGDAADTLGWLSFGRRLACETGATVVAMRYEVGDEFAICFGQALYSRIFDSKQPIAAAVNLAIASAIDAEVQGAQDLRLSAITPVIFSADADTARIIPPKLKDAAEFFSPFAKLGWFPDEAELFVGRSVEMAKALAVMRTDSTTPVSQIVGLAGMGKTALAVELAYRVASEFEAMVFWSASEFLTDPFLALGSFASSLDRQLAVLGVAFSPHFTSKSELHAFLPRMRQLLKFRGILFCLDGLEALLSSSGKLRDERWVDLLKVLCEHPGFSRTIITTSNTLTDLPPESVVRLPALSAGEAILLARGLPNFRRILDRARAEWLSGDKRKSQMVQDLMGFAQGHPSMLRFVDSVAEGDGQKLIDLLKRDTQGVLLTPGPGASDLGSTSVVETLQSATMSSLEQSGSDAHLLAGIMVVMKATDRRMPAISFVWQLLKQAPVPTTHGSNGNSDAAADLQASLEDALAELVRLLIVDIKSTPRATSQERAALLVLIPPVVESTILAGVSAALYARVSEAMVQFWQEWLNNASETAGMDNARILPGLAGAPYLIRLGRFSDAGAMIERATVRDRSPQVLNYALPLLKRVRNETQEDSDVACYAETLYAADRDAGRQEMLEALTIAEGRSNHRLIAVMLEFLANDDAERGSWADAESRLARARVELRLASSPPDRLTLLSLQITELLTAALQADEPATLAKSVLDFRALHDELQAGPRTGNGFSEYWMVEEFLARTGRTIAVKANDWGAALAFSNILIASLKRRGAVEHTVAVEAVPSYYPLIREFEIDEARQLLVDCQTVFTECGDFEHLGLVYGARATVAKMDGDLDEALRWQERALKLKYRNLDIAGCAVSHQNIANLCHEPLQVLAHRFAGCILELKFKGALSLRASAALGRLIADGISQSRQLAFKDIADVVSQIDGVDLRLFVTDDVEGAELVGHVLSEALAVNPELLYRDFLEPFRPFLTSVADLANGNSSMRAMVVDGIRNIATKDRVSANRLQRIIAGERGGWLLDGLLPRQRALIAEVLRLVD